MIAVEMELKWVSPKPLGGAQKRNTDLINRIAFGDLSVFAALELLAASVVPEVPISARLAPDEPHHQASFLARGVRLLHAAETRLRWSQIFIALSQFAIRFLRYLADCDWRRRRSDPEATI